MTIISSFALAFRGLMANKVRSALTMLGIIIGIASVITLMSMGEGIKSTITGEIESMGSNLLFVVPGGDDDDDSGSGWGQKAYLTYEDALALTENDDIPGIIGVSPFMSTWAQVVAGENDVSADITGICADYDKVFTRLNLTTGMFIDENDQQRGALVCILGAKVSKKLFGDANPVGQTVRINERKFTVKGVLEEKGGMVSDDDAIMIPITTVMNRMKSSETLTGEHYIDYAAVKVASESELNITMEQIKSLIRERHRISEGDGDDFSIISQKEILDMVNVIVTGMTMFLGAIAAISLLVGGIGIMNIMLVSVTERTREIGIRKALGARKLDILIQFLIEAATLSLIAGAIGMSIGWGFSELFTMAKIEMEGSVIEAVITWNMVALAVGVAVSIGVFFGVWPAARAARLNPIDALRYE